MTSSDFIPVILAGGSGEWFWPLSHKHKPKQFLRLGDLGRSLLQTIGDRLALQKGRADRTMVITGNDYHSQVVEQLPETPLEKLIKSAECGKVPATLYANLHIFYGNLGALVGIFPGIQDIKRSFDNLRIIPNWSVLHD